MNNIYSNKPQLFEYDKKNKIIDVFIRQDPDCPFPFTNGEWFHQGFSLDEFKEYLKALFWKNDLGNISF